jgi:hypothetical protein
MIEKRPLKITEPRTATNGSGEITCDSPLPDKLRELERRMSAALSSDRTADQLADLLADSDRGIAAADEYARAEHERALDPLKVPTHTPLVSKPRMRNSCVVIALAVEPHGLLKDRPIIAVEAEHEKAEHHDARRGLVRNSLGCGCQSASPKHLHRGPRAPLVVSTSRDKPPYRRGQYHRAVSAGPRAASPGPAVFTFPITACPPSLTWTCSTRTYWSPP